MKINPAMTIKIQHPFRKSEIKQVEDWLKLNTEGMTIEVHKFRPGMCHFEVQSEHPMDFYKFGIYSAIHLDALHKLRAIKELRRKQQEN